MSESSLLDEAQALAAAYESATIAELADRLGVSCSTVRRALVRHGIDRKARNRNRRPATARVLDDGDWLRAQYRSRTGVEIAAELGVSSRTVYAAMDRHGIDRRTQPGTLPLRHPQLADGGWLESAAERSSSRVVAGELEVSAGTVTSAYRRAGITPGSTPHLFARGHRIARPSVDALREAWGTEGSFRGVGRRFGASHTTAAVWLAEVGLFLDATPKLPRSSLKEAIELGSPITKIAAEHRVSVTTVRIELHRNGLFDAHRVRHRS